jgi:site-specific DNA-adenine methylase
LSYPGGKGGAGVYQAIINQMPPHEVYIEPFLGAGSVLRTKRPAALNRKCTRRPLASRHHRNPGK